MRVSIQILLICAGLVLGTAPCFAQNTTADYMRRTFGHAPPPPSCSTQEFYVEFEPGQDAPRGTTPSSFDANIDAARNCNVLTVFVAGHNSSQIAVVRDLLIQEGLMPKSVQTHEFAVPIAPPPYVTDRVRVTFVFR
ncbi:hypothetical protein DSM104635_00695 [Terricaulis silvestris]|uniref:Uncharacterized protein n=1 Tax=Terricaulis silvestris TaxID=2686094 RepID=A0A6I6MJ66_9CAUL|nr:hypothetical protein DSM104635_00695 [Terricaulis silvestris]